jgi:DNA-binding CsgD family transcriptional regulator
MYQIPGGLIGKSAELFTAVINGVKQPFCLFGGKTLTYEQIPADKKKILMDAMRANPKVEKAMQSMAGQNDDDKLKQFIMCRYGALNCDPDITEDGKLSEAEYVPCDKRGKCSFEGIGCCSILMDNGVFLSRAETDVFKLVENADKNIADKLFLSVDTVKKHFTNIRMKTGLHNKIEMAVWAAKKGII